MSARNAFVHYKYAMILLTAVSFMLDYIRIYLYYKHKLSVRICSASIIGTVIFFVLMTVLLLKAFRTVQFRFLYVIPILIPITLPIALWEYMNRFIKSSILTTNRVTMSPVLSSQSLLYPTHRNSYSAINVNNNNNNNNTPSSSSLSSQYHHNNQKDSSQQALVLRDFLFQNVIISPKLNAFPLKRSHRTQYRDILFLLLFMYETMQLIIQLCVIIYYRQTSILYLSTFIITLFTQFMYQFSLTTQSLNACHYILFQPYHYFYTICCNLDIINVIFIICCLFYHYYDSNLDKNSINFIIKIIGLHVLMDIVAFLLAIIRDIFLCITFSHFLSEYGGESCSYMWRKLIIPFTRLRGFANLMEKRNAIICNAYWIDNLYLDHTFYSFNVNDEYYPQFHSYLYQLSLFLQWIKHSKININNHKICKNNVEIDTLYRIYCGYLCKLYKSSDNKQLRFVIKYNDMNTIHLKQQLTNLATNNHYGKNNTFKVRIVDNDSDNTYDSDNLYDRSSQNSENFIFDININHNINTITTDKTKLLHRYRYSCVMPIHHTKQLCNGMNNKIFINKRGKDYICCGFCCHFINSFIILLLSWIIYLLIVLSKIFILVFPIFALIVIGIDTKNLMDISLWSQQLLLLLILAFINCLWAALFIYYLYRIFKIEHLIQKYIFNKLNNNKLNNETGDIHNKILSNLPNNFNEETYRLYCNGIYLMQIEILLTDRFGDLGYLIITYIAIL